MKPKKDEQGWRFEDLDPELKAEIEEGIAAADAGEEGIPAEEVLASLRRRTEAYRATQTAKRRSVR